jgi:Uma2 family endonuclease
MRRAFPTYEISIMSTADDRPRQDARGSGSRYHSDPQPPHQELAMPPLQPRLHTRSTASGRALPSAGFDPQAARRAARARLRALPHPPEHYDGIPYYDHELDIPQSIPHAEMVHDFGNFLRQVASAAALRVQSDNPIWYWIAETSEQKPFYPDYALAEPVDLSRITALDLRLVVELVSTATPAKEQKDTVRMRELNAANGVPEFLLLYPEPEDRRALRWFSLDDTNGGYREWPVPDDRRYRSQSVPGLEIEVLPPEAWQPGRKVRLWYRGDRLPALDEAVWQAEQATRQAEQATREAEQARRAREIADRQFEQARAENERLLARLREAGLEPIRDPIRAS